MAITYAFLSGNQKKTAEYASQLARYGRAVRILPYADDEAQRLSEICTYLRAAGEKDRYVLRETSDLFVAVDWEQGVPRVSAKTTQGEGVYNVSTLTVYTLDDAGSLQHKTYQAAIKGHIDLTLRHGEPSDGWWDDIFVPDRSRASYNQERELWGKSSARQQAIGRFICDHVLFKRLRDVTFNPHNPSQAVDFDPRKSAASVLRGDAFIGMARLDESPWGLGNLLTHIINEGAFFRSADSSRSGNYFCPPVSGIPRTQKADPFWESTYRFHDFCHQAIPDLLFTGNNSPEHRNVYVAARLMSEGLTIVQADMLFVEAVKGSGFDYDFSVRKINPLYDSLALPAGTHDEQLKALLRANVTFANLGDDTLYRAMLKPGAEEALNGYTETYKHFFVPDLLWSAGNFDDMVARKETFAAWKNLVGEDLFGRARLPLLDDLVESLKAAGADLSSYESCVGPVFEHLFEKVLAPKLRPVEPISDEQAQSNAFLRYMIGQTFLYATYRHVEGMMDRGRRMIAELRKQECFSQPDISRLRNLYREDLKLLQEHGIITADDLVLYSQIFPLFSPRFLSYNFDQAVCQSVPEAIRVAFATTVLT